jgi:hypothetical protein
MLRQESLLLALPDSCLQAVLQRCAADDQRSLLSAARSHSRLRHSAAVVLRSITIQLPQQHKAQSVLQYLRTHGKHVSSIELIATEPYPVRLRQLPPELQLTNLQLEWFDLQLYAGDGTEWASSPWVWPEPATTVQGVLGDVSRLAALTQLRLTDCDLLDPAWGVLAALSVLTGLEHLSISRIYHKVGGKAHFPPGIFPQMQQLTYLELAGMYVVAPSKAKVMPFPVPPVFFFGGEGHGGGQADEGQGLEGQGEADGEAAALQPLQALTRLVELRLDALQLDTMVPVGPDSEVGGTIATPCRITASQLASTNLKCLVFSGGVEVEPEALAGKTQLQHLDLDLNYTVLGAAAEVAQLLSHIQQLQELTHLRLPHLRADGEGAPPAAAYSALTASSKLQHLDITDCRVAAGIWEHLFPAGRQLPHLRSLNIAHVQEPNRVIAIMPEGSRLASCCPSLQTLDLGGLQGLNAARLAPLQGLSGLQTLRIVGWGLTSDGWQAVCQLAGLRELDLCYCRATREQLLQSTQLQQLTRFVYRRFVEEFVLTAQVGWGWDVAVYQALPCISEVVAHSAASVSSFRLQQASLH